MCRRVEFSSFAFVSSGAGGSKGWPTPEPSDYVLWLNRSQGREEVEKIRYAIQRSRPYGSDQWVSNAIGKFGLKNNDAEPRARKKVPDSAPG